MSDFKNFDEMLNSKSEFNSSLNGKRISDKECKHVLKVCIKLEIKRMKDYHNWYLKRDVLMFASVFEKFRNRYLEN